MKVIHLSSVDLGIAAALVVALALVSWRGRLALERPLLISAARLVVQLALIGYVLQALFAVDRLIWIVLMAFAMLALAGREVHARQRRPLAGAWSYGIGTGAMCISAFAVTLFALLAIVRPVPWYEPQYAIPLLGMLLGNTMTGVALALERLTEGAWRQRRVIEGRMLLGETWRAAFADVRLDAVRAGMIPTINAMAAAGIVSLPGMMTGQILAGSPPLEAVRYQILIFLLIAIGTGGGTLLATELVSRRLFDERARLRLERLRPAAP